MGETDGSEKNDTAAKDKHQKKEDDGKGEKGEEKGKDKKKKKDKSGKEGKDDGGKEKEKKKKNPEDKQDPAQLKLKLEKIDAKMQALAAKREEILKLLNQVEANPPATPN